MDTEDKIKAENKAEEEVAKNGFMHRLKARKKLLILSLIVLILGAVFFVVALKLINASPFVPGVENATLADQSDEIIDFDTEAREENLLESIERDEYLYKIHEANYFLIPRNNIRYVRLELVLQAKRDKDLDAVEKNEVAIREAINQLIRNHTVEDFEGVAGKEAMKERILKAVNERLPVALIKVHYGSLSFH